MFCHLLKPKAIQMKPTFGGKHSLSIKLRFLVEKPSHLKEVSPRFACSDLCAVPTPLSVTLHHSARRWKSCNPPPLSSNFLHLRSLQPFVKRLKEKATCVTGFFFCLFHFAFFLSAAQIICKSQRGPGCYGQAKQGLAEDRGLSPPGL